MQSIIRTVESTKALQTCRRELDSSVIQDCVDSSKAEMDISREVLDIDNGRDDLSS